MFRWECHSHDHALAEKWELQPPAPGTGGLDWAYSEIKTENLRT